MVDSGSTTTFIPTELAEILELPKVKDEKATGAGGRFDTYVAKLERLTLIKGSHPFVAFDNIEVMVAKEGNAIPYVVLGRDYLFQKFHVTFREAQQHVIFRRR